jgi:hypothetical protein
MDADLKKVVIHFKNIDKGFRVGKTLRKNILGKMSQIGYVLSDFSLKKHQVQDFGAVINKFSFILASDSPLLDMNVDDIKIED